MENLKLNKNGVNAAIKAVILPEKDMREIGFTDYNPSYWTFCRWIDFPKTKRYQGFEITFSVSIPKDGSDICIDVLDEMFCQPYDYQYMLSKDPKFMPCRIVYEQVEMWMEYLQEKGVLFGHTKGEYI